MTRALIRYGVWAGNPSGIREDIRLCIFETYGRTYKNFIPYQCSRKRGHGPNGEYCRQHAKMAREEAK